jgi:hypothetical protein
MGPCWPISRLAQQLPHLRRRRQQPHQRACRAKTPAGRLALVAPIRVRDR